MNTSGSNNNLDSSFRGLEPKVGRFDALVKLVPPLLRLTIIWMVLSVVAILVSLYTTILLHYFLLLGSIISIISSAFILFAGYMASASHRKTFVLIYALTGCFLFFAIKMFLTAVIAVEGYDLAWQAQNTAWCYAMALWGQISYMAGLGYTFVLLFDILFILGNPMFYSRNKKTFHLVYHVSIWLLVLISCIPAMAANAIGLNKHGTCWFQGDYTWSAWGFIFFFAVFSFSSIFYLLAVMCVENHHLTSAATASVLHQTVLIAIAFVLSWIWNWTFHAMIIAEAVPPYWLSAVQIFWLGGVGFNNALIWFPFIRKALVKASQVASVSMYRMRHPSSLYKQTSISTSSKHHSRGRSGKGGQVAIELPERRGSLQADQIVVGGSEDIVGVHFDIEN